MTPEMADAMQLHNQGEQSFLDDPEAPISVRDARTGMMEGMSPEALAAEGLAFSHEYMGSNHPVKPLHSVADRERGLDMNKMTKAQLGEQKMNEDQGYPSNLDEAQKVRELEGKVANIESGIGAILSHLQNGQSSLESDTPPVLSGGSPESPVANKILMQAQSETVLQPSLPSTDSSGSNEPENKQPPPQQVTLSDGRKISVPQTSSRAMGLGPATDPTIASTLVSGVEAPLETGDDWDNEPVVETPPPTSVEPKVDPKLEQTQHLIQEVAAFMQANDVHRFWRRHLARNVHRHVGYSGWPKPLQEEFDKRFQGFLNDPQFINTVCRKIISMEYGPALGVKWVTSFIVTAAGFTAFTLCGLDG